MASTSQVSLTSSATQPQVPRSQIFSPENKKHSYWTHPKRRNPLEGKRRPRWGKGKKVTTFISLPVSITEPSTPIVSVTIALHVWQSGEKNKYWWPKLTGVTAQSSLMNFFYVTLKNHQGSLLRSREVRPDECTHLSKCIKLYTKIYTCDCMYLNI